MTSRTLAASYLVKAQKRLKALEVLWQEDAYSDVVREAQEIVELALKALLRSAGIEPPKVHDVGPMLTEHANRFDARIGRELPALVTISAWLRKEREFAFYGDIDFIPTERYDRAMAEKALTDAKHVVTVVVSQVPSEAA